MITQLEKTFLSLIKDGFGAVVEVAQLE
jgi:hypothetical protein